MATQIAKTTQSLTTAAQMRDYTKMLMQPNANWEEYLTPAPLSVAILGELVFISSSDDFSIAMNPNPDQKKFPPKVFKYIKYPDSFRACLMQICNSGWHAFNEAHKNMDQIRIHTGTVPVYMKTAVKILFNASDEIIATLLPPQLESIRTIADECVKLANSVEKKYSDVINLIQELLEACVSTKYIYGEELEKVKLKLKETKLREQTATRLNEQSRKAMEAMSKQMEETQDAYKQSMDSLPSGWDMIALDFVDGIASTVTGIINGCVSLLTGSSKKADGSGGSGESSTHQNSRDENVDDIANMTICCKSAEILNLAVSIKEYVTEAEIDWENLYDQKDRCTKTMWTEKQFKRVSQELGKKPKTNLCKDALSLCERGINICRQLEKYAHGDKLDEKMTTELVKEIRELNDSALAFDSRSKKKLNAPALAPKPPMMFKAEKKSSGYQSAGQRAFENARFRVEQSREQLKQTRKSYEKCVENMEKNQRELNEILIQMQSCKIKEIDFETKIKMLVKGLDAMGKVKEQWEKMVRFFQVVSNIINTSLSKTLYNFVQTCDATQKLAYDHKFFTKDILYTQAFQASNIASLVHMISATYSEVSNKYLMDRVSSLGKLMAMDPEKTEFLWERVKLQESCQKAQAGILRLVLKNKKEFERKTDIRMAKIQAELKAILPAAPPQDTEKLKEIVQSAFDSEEEEEDDYY